mgnify:FL=1|jgi:hypothetical protein
MILNNEDHGIKVGSLVMNYHHSLLRFGVVQSARVDEEGWTQFRVDFLEDDIHERNKKWDKKMGNDRSLEEYRADLIKPVSPEWLRNVAYSYRRHQNERTN